MGATGFHLLSNGSLGGFFWFLLNIRSADCKPQATHFKDLDDYLISTCSWDVPWQKPAKLTARHKTSAYFPAGFTRPAFSKAKR